MDIYTDMNYTTIRKWPPLLHVLRLHALVFSNPVLRRIHVFAISSWEVTSYCLTCIESFSECFREGLRHGKVMKKIKASNMNASIFKYSCFSRNQNLKLKHYPWTCPSSSSSLKMSESLKSSISIDPTFDISASP